MGTTDFESGVSQSLGSAPTRNFSSGVSQALGGSITSGSGGGSTPITGVTGSVVGEGNSFTSTTGFNSLNTKPVRSAFDKFLERRDQRILDLALTPEDPNEAELCWGGLYKPVENPANQLGVTGFNTRQSKDEPKKPDEDKSYQWNEQKRYVVKTKITNPEDDEQYVWVNKCEVMIITAPSQPPFNGKTHTFTFKGEEIVTRTDDGGNSGSGETEGGSGVSPGPARPTKPSETGSGSTTGGGAAP